MSAHLPNADPAGERPDGPAGQSGPSPTYPMVVWPEPPAPPEPKRGPARRLFVDLGVGAGTALAVVLLGVPLGLLWAVVAPDVPAIKVEDGAVPTDPQPEQFIAADGWFSLLGMAIGVLAAVAVWLVLRRHRGPLGLVAVVLGALGAGRLAWWIGREMSRAEYDQVREAAVGERIDLPPVLRAVEVDGLLPGLAGSLLLPALAAAVTYTLLAGWSRYPDLRPQPQPTVASWDSTAPRTPPVPPAPPAPGAAEPPPG